MEKRKLTKSEIPLLAGINPWMEYCVIWDRPKERTGEDVALRLKKTRKPIIWDDGTRVVFDLTGGHWFECPSSDLKKRKSFADALDFPTRLPRE